jgi:glycosyltransferase involved in cell wall biosynthesis
MFLSIVVPIFNEADNLPTLYQEIVAFIGSQGIEFELILVDDGSHDSSFAIMAKLAENDPRCKVIRLRRNFGQTAAMVAGFDAASGDIIVPMDGDLQNNPADIPRLLAKIGEGYDVVSGWRKNRKDTFVTRRLPSLFANLLISKMTDVRLHDYGCTLKAYRKEVLDHVQLYGELHRFVPALAFQLGARVTEIPVSHRSRTAGKTSYGIDRTLRVILDLVTVKFLLKYSTRPLQLFGQWAFGSFALSLIAFLTTLFMKYAEGLSMNRNPLLILSAFLLFSGVQFIALGLLGELVTRTYHEVQNKSIYTVQKTINLGRGR